jgi:hypothetical protein
MTITGIIVTIDPLRLQQLNRSETGTNLRVGVEPAHQKFVMVYKLVFAKIFNRKKLCFNVLGSDTIPPLAPFSLLPPARGAPSAKDESAGFPVTLRMDKSLLVLFFRKEQKRKTLLFLKKKKQKDFFYGCGFK